MADQRWTVSQVWRPDFGSPSVSRVALSPQAPVRAFLSLPAPGGTGGPWPPWLVTASLKSLPLLDVALSWRELTVTWTEMGAMVASQGAGLGSILWRWGWQDVRMDLEVAFMGRDELRITSRFFSFYSGGIKSSVWGFWV